MSSINNLSVLVTGAAGGIGQALVKALDKAGANLILTDVNEERLKHVSSTLAKCPPFFVADVSNPTDRALLINFCEQQDPPLQMVINLAGINHFGALSDHNDVVLERMLMINLQCQIALCRDLLPLLSQNQPSTIINVGSILGSIGIPGYSVYCATKFGLRGFSEALGRELSDTKVAVRYFAPRATKTALNDARVNEMNAALGNKADTPEHVAEALLAFIETDKKRHYLGWPEKFFVRLNSILPGLVDNSFIKQLPTIKRFFQ